jgi:hypothetical protein
MGQGQGAIEYCPMVEIFHRPFCVIEIFEHLRQAAGVFASTRRRWSAHISMLGL